MGGQKGIACFYEYFSKLLPVTIITTKNNEFPAQQDAHFLPLLSNSRTRYINPFLFFVLRRVIRKKKITHLILEHPYYGWLGILLKWFCNIKLVVHSHNIEATRFRSNGKWWWPVLFQYEKFTHRRADINFFITDIDREFAIQNFKLAPGSCHAITYGFDLKQPPTPKQRMEAKMSLILMHGIKASEKILFFNGTLDYKPNLDAVDFILQEINPRLLKKDAFEYKVIICGKNLPVNYDELKAYQSKNIIYAGFVSDISTYFMGADIFINPVIDGGGIKTKLIEALGSNLSCISTKSGATGVNKEITGNKLQILADGDWETFTNTIFEANTADDIPNSFFDYFYWGNITARAARILNP
ncbi:MAG: glycosyltransferase family 4 protein [Ferruginibacter sp.]